MKIELETMKNELNSILAKQILDYDLIDRISIEDTGNHFDVQADLLMFSKSIHCSCRLDTNFKLVEHHCECALDHHDVCGHVLAVLMKLNEMEINAFPFQYQSNKREKLIKLEQERRIERRKEELKNLAFSSRKLIENNRSKYNASLKLAMQKDQYELTPTFSINDEHLVTVQYQIGNQKKYIVKDVEALIHHVEHQEYHSYGKFLGFIHSEKNFTDFAQKQLQLIKQSVVNYFQDVEDMRYDYYYSMPPLGKTITIDVRTLDDFYRVYEEYGHFGVIEKPLKIHIKEEFDYYVVYLIFDGSFYCGQKHIYQFGNENDRFFMNRKELDEEGLSVKLITSFIEENGQLVIHKDQYFDFYKYVLLPVSSYFEIDDQSEHALPVYDEIKIYGDVENGQDIYFQPVYVDQNQNRIYGFQKNMLTNYQQDMIENYISDYADAVDYDKHRAYFKVDSEKTYEFIFEGLEYLKNYGDVYVSEALKRIGKKQSYQLQVGVRLHHDLLEFDISSEEIPQDEIRDVLSHYRRKKKFYRLKNGELLYLDSPDIAELSDFMDEYHVETQDIEDGKFKMNQQRMLAINNEKDDFEFIKLERNKSFTDKVEHFVKMDPKSYPVIDSYKDILRDYQKDGYVWLHTLKDYGFNGILADDMGLGKTLQIIALLESLSTDKPSLVVCPSSLIYNWEDEVHKFSKVLKITCITGMQNVRKEIIEHIDQGIYVTSYDYMRRDYELYENVDFEYVILDEAQYIKNQKTQNARSVKTLNASHKLALTGTPIENSLAELWSIFDFLMPQYLFNYHYFQNYYEKDIVKNKDESKTAQLKRMVEPFILRRNKKDVLKELPDKIEQNLILPFNDEEKKLYIASLAQVNKELSELYNIEGSDKMQILKMLTRLRQLCLEPRMIYENIDHPSSKLKACMDLLKTFKENNQKVLLFSSFTQALDLISEECRKAGIAYYKLTGSTKKETRRELIANYQKDDTNVFLISLKAGGTGLNLTAAEAVIHFDPWWNVSAQNQATDRAYRIGQKHNVQVINLVMKDSVEEKILKLQKEKKELADMFVENNTGALSQMSKEDIIDLFKM
ncbi:DEAD/DEAH box helicase [[Clostridium] spiroforme]|nr:DEAD/DEAH box helicase [Thomasclavelia spiroformis]